MSALKRLSITEILNRDAAALVRAREEAGSIHGTGDIRAAGNQVEVQFRRILKKRLPARYRVTHGHALDSRGFVSPEVDAIVVDAMNSPSVFEADDGTEYVPFEGIYALGELKSTYYKSRSDIEKVIQT